jgi:hypothetical protein
MLKLSTIRVENLILPCYFRNIATKLQMKRAFQSMYIIFTVLLPPILEEQPLN